MEARSRTPGARMLSQAVIDEISKRRQTIKENEECDKIMFMLGKMPACTDKYGLNIMVFDAIRQRSLDPFWNMYQAFQYGIIQGKRIERKKRHRKDI